MNNFVNIIYELLTNFKGSRLSIVLFYVNIICMIPDFRVSLSRIDRTPALHPILSSISVIDKPGIDADSCDIKLKATRSLAIPESGTDVTVWLGHQGAGVSEVFKGVVDKVGYSYPPTELFIQATGVPLSDGKTIAEQPYSHGYSTIFLCLLNLVCPDVLHT